MGQKALPYEIILIGASMGGIDAAIQILKPLSSSFPIPILLILHRYKSPHSGLVSIFQRELILQVREIEEKDQIQQGMVYIAPADYHVLIELDKSFSLDDSEPVNFSRPSIDISFESAAEVFGKKTIGIVLTGNNADGSSGLQKISRKGGLTIVQNPEEAEATIMPSAALKKVSSAKALKLKEISILLQLI